ncbi:MAG TPA: hypothetical protein VNE59_16190 [Burkholderiales bacterium]|nr:hypothetical protein [Burkholderiales bacterium]
MLGDRFVNILKLRFITKWMARRSTERRQAPQRAPRKPPRGAALTGGTGNTNILNKT